MSNSSRVWIVALFVSLIFLGIRPEPAQAQKGRSYSGGSRSSGSSSAGRSYSSGSRSAPSRPTAPRSAPSSPAPAKRSSPAPSPPKSTPSPLPGASSKPSPRPSPPSSNPTPPKGRSYASGDSTTAVGGTRPDPGKSHYDSAAGAAQRREESRSRYNPGNTPKPSYKDRNGEERTLDPKDTRVEDLRRRTSPTQWETREQRRRDIFLPAPQPGPIIVYRDPYSDWFWWWMLAQSLDHRASWAYHHRASMDEERYKELIRRDAQLEAKIKELEAKQVHRDATYTPPGVDPDLMYSDEYAEAAYNPQPAPRGPSSGFKWLTIVLVILLLGFVVWLIFFKRWAVNGSKRTSKTR